MVRSLWLGAVLGVLWILWSGDREFFLLSLGALSVVGIVALTRRLQTNDDEALPDALLTPALFAYLPWLAWQVLLANIDVIKRILGPASGISPRLTKLEPLAKTEVGRVLFAQSITLTPGTVTVNLDPSGLLVHAIAPGPAEDLEAGEMNRRVASVERS